MTIYGFHVMRYHDGKILFWYERRGKRYEFTETFTLGI